MAKQTFTPEQVQFLKENPYTKSVSPSSIRFTDQFKDEFWMSYLAGKTPVEIFLDKGYDINVIGQKRISNTLYAISRERSARDSKSKSKDYVRLENEIKRLNSELNALKKIIALNNSRK